MAKVQVAEYKGYKFPSKIIDSPSVNLLEGICYSKKTLSGDDLSQKFAVLEIQDKLQALKAKFKKKSEFATPKASIPNIEPEKISPTTQLPETWRCVRTLKSQLGAVNAIAISPDGTTLISGSDDRQVNLWNLKTGKWLYTFSGQAEAVLSVAISPDGQQIASGNVDVYDGLRLRKISSWQMDTKKFIQTFFYLNSAYSHNGFVNSVAYSPDGAILASGAADNTIRIWGRYTGRVKRTLNEHSDAVLSVTISPDGKILASGSADKTIRVWDVKTWQQRYILSEHLGAVNTVAISFNSQTLISGSTDTTIKLWNLQTGELLSTLTGHSTAVLSVAISPDGKTLASASRDGTIKLWKLCTRELLQNLSGCNPVAFSPDGKTLVSGGNGGSIKIWSQFTLDSGLSGEWWEVLGVNQSDRLNVVKLAYRRLARLYHPDVNSSTIAKASMQAINRAYKEFQQQVI
ncbi:DnaJ domain-containing protein [Nostocales cyanobacterium LEGE 12452]|nr:DnaJ domain-containing protein [Nostocales cyanobacterium LEGE 12452]